MRFVSWNVNGMRSVLQKGFEDFFFNVDADVFCIQETKMQPGQVEVITNDYTQYWNSAVRKGYSGTAVFVKKSLNVLNVTFGLGIEEHDNEGRVITIEFEKFYLVNVYTPNSKRELLRLGYRMEWEDAFSEYLKKLDKHKSVVMCGDLNVAHKEIDLANPSTNHNNAGFTDEERNKMTELLEKNNFIDTYRFLFPDREKDYTWWSYMNNAREKNIGWRIDYFIISNRLKDNLTDAYICKEIYGSDHCPVGIEIKI